MTKEEIASKLALYAEQEMKVKLEQTKWRNTESSWSKSFASTKGDELQILSNIFGLDVTKELERLFKSATNGDGDERSKILTLHSSSLLAFLCFCNVREHSIKIDDTEYNEIMFEVKNDVIAASLGKPSNIDILLLGENRTKLLYLESKFTEYLKGDRVDLSPKRYEQFYTILSDNIELPFKASILQITHKPDKRHAKSYTTDEYCLNNGESTNEYLDGIKQAFSHLLGIVTGPAKTQAPGNEIYNLDLLENAKEIKFASIVFDCDQAKYDDYSKLYASVFKNKEEIKNAIKEVLHDRNVYHDNIIDKLTIVPELKSYQEVFATHPLPKKVRDFYSCVNESDIKF
ncbi:MAG: hypothetical protein HDR82_06265 [Bacteroides sp.]|nr:hypothetical protein [Bacteroides sp.]